MPRLLTMPTPAAGATAATLLEWAVAEGAEFAELATLAVIETDKAVLDVDADEPGVLVRQLVPAGTLVEVGAPIALLAAAGESVADLDRALAGLRLPDAAPAPGPPSAPPAPATAPAPPRRIFASPLARRLARENGIPVESLTPTGPGGRIVRRDVESALADRQPTVTPPEPEQPIPPASPGLPGDLVPLTRMRQAIATRLTESKQQVPHFYLAGSARAEALLDLRAELTSEADEIRVSINDLIVKAVAVAHRRHPELNSIWAGDAIRRFDQVDVSVAVATDKGLLTPVVRAADRLSIGEIARTTKDFAERARAGRLRQGELEGGAVTVSNLGMYGTEEFAAIINPPQSAILGIGAIRRVPVVDGDEVRVGRLVRFVLSADHRTVDGATAAGWLRTFTGLLEHPARILA